MLLSKGICLEGTLIFNGHQVFGTDITLGRGNFTQVSE